MLNAFVTYSLHLYICIIHVHAMQYSEFLFTLTYYICEISGLEPEKVCINRYKSKTSKKDSIEVQLISRNSYSDKFFDIISSIFCG